MTEELFFGDASLQVLLDDDDCVLDCGQKPAEVGRDWDSNILTDFTGGAEVDWAKTEAAKAESK